MRVLHRIGSLLLLATVLLSGCRGYDLRLFQGWDRLNMDCCYVQFPEGMDPSLVESKIRWQWPAIKTLQERFFPTLQDFKPLIIVYRDQEEYRRASRHLPDNALAHYDRSRKAIHVSIDAKGYVWQHEMSHLYLDELSPETPFWFQEGLARLLQNYSTQKPPCSEQSLLPEFRAWIERDPNALVLETMNLPDSIDFMQADSVQKTVLSGVFVFFLWERGHLRTILQGLAKNPDADPLFPITYGERGAMEDLREDYMRYLANPVFSARPGHCNASFLDPESRPRRHHFPGRTEAAQDPALQTSADAGASASQGRGIASFKSVEMSSLLK